MSFTNKIDRERIEHMEWKSKYSTEIVRFQITQRLRLICLLLIIELVKWWIRTKLYHFDQRFVAHQVALWERKFWTHYYSWWASVLSLNKEVGWILIPRKRSPPSYSIMQNFINPGLSSSSSTTNLHASKSIPPSSTFLKGVIVYP